MKSVSIRAAIVHGMQHGHAILSAKPPRTPGCRCDPWGPYRALPLSLNIFVINSLQGSYGCHSPFHSQFRVGLNHTLRDRLSPSRTTRRSPPRQMPPKSWGTALHAERRQRSETGAGGIDRTRAGLFGRLRGRQTAVGRRAGQHRFCRGCSDDVSDHQRARSASFCRLYRRTWCALPRAFVPAEGATKPWGELRERGPAGQRRQRPGSSGGCPVQGSDKRRSVNFRPSDHRHLAAGRAGGGFSRPQHPAVGHSLRAGRVQMDGHIMLVSGHWPG